MDYAKRHPTNHLVRKYTAKIAETARVQETLKAAVLACEVACAALPNTPPPGPKLPPPAAVPALPPAVPITTLVPNFSAGLRPGDLDLMVNGGTPWQPTPEAPQPLPPWVHTMLMSQFATTEAMQEQMRCQSRKLRQVEDDLKWHAEQSQAMRELFGHCR